MTEVIASDVPLLRVHAANRGAVVPTGDYVLYWMTANRRTRWNYSLERAIDWARSLRKPLLVFEPLRCGYAWASDRFHYFVMQGMADTARRLTGKPITYYPYLEPVAGAGRGLLAALAERACLVVGDDFPCFFLPRMAKSAARQTAVRVELVDSNGLLPLRAASQTFKRACDFRRFLQRELREHLVALPKSDPLHRLRLPTLAELPAAIVARWPAAEIARLATSATSLAAFPIDHSVPATNLAGGAVAAEARMHTFLDQRLAAYNDSRNTPDGETTSGLSPYLHFGHLSAHEVFVETMTRASWSLGKLAERATGSAHDWWGADDATEAFLDQLVTWRELGFNMCSQRADYDQFESLPAWAQKTLADHAHDRRQPAYSLAELEGAATHDPIWNAAQRQLTRDGTIHNYLRMLWGKKILEWTSSPQAAWQVMVELNNKYALDGRDPNSYSGIGWIFGRYDRAWGPERPIFGKVRYMSSENTARKLSLRTYLERYGGDSSRRAPH